MIRFDYGFIKPQYVAYAKQWDINWFSLSLHKKIWITPQETHWTFILCGIFGVVLKIKIPYGRD